MASPAAAPPRGGGATGGVRLIVWDFDQTLACVHVFKILAGWDGGAIRLPGPGASTELGQLRRLQDLSSSNLFPGSSFAESAFGGRERVQELQHNLGALRQSGVQMVVCTKGLVGPVRFLLEDLGLLPFFGAVFGRIGDTYGINGYDKSVLRTQPSAREAAILGQREDSDWDAKTTVINRMKQRLFLDGSCTFFIDDDPEEIKRARQHCKTLWIRDGKGITPEQWQIVFKECQMAGGEATPGAAAATPGPQESTRRENNRAAGAGAAAAAGADASPAGLLPDASQKMAGLPPHMSSVDSSAFGSQFQSGLSEGTDHPPSPEGQGRGAMGVLRRLPGAGLLGGLWARTVQALENIEIR
eukprot:TRINITY_DN46465_c0_g1_i1.p1 TRINITY_DN46465_c0_g1~~TRINITY_DN46465_c0_g1_i1.p1  ORF type:complete len:357 (-),score=79.28 TRINITY_DN46465_c0_g1_i1:165-1235(-)